MTDQLDGEWFLRMAGIGGNLPDERVRAVLSEIFSHNYTPDGGLVNVTCPEDRPVTLQTYRNCQAEANWTGIGYAFAALVAGLICGRPRMGKKASIVRISIAALCGFVVMYIPGVIHFMRTLDKTFAETMALCVTPYIPGDLIKMVVAILITIPLRKTVAAFVFQDEPKGKKEDKEKKVN